MHRTHESSVRYALAYDAIMMAHGIITLLNHEQCLVGTRSKDLVPLVPAMSDFSEFFF